MTIPPNDFASQQFMLCRPCGGLNDTLVQIYRCYKYSKKHRRTLIIDSRYSGVYLPFSIFFELSQSDPSVILSLDAELSEHLETLECRPAELQGKIGSYKVRYSSDANGYVCTSSGVPTDFNFKSAAIEPLVVHHNCGGGKRSITMLRLLRLQPSVAQEITRRLSGLPKSYVALQVRNTDMKSDYLEFFRSVAPSIDGRFVVVCSDDDKVMAAAAEMFGSDKTISLRQIGGFEGKTLHHLHAKIGESTKFNIVLDALTDLMAMALSDGVHVAPNSAGMESGFGRLGFMLQAKKSIAMQLLRRPISSLYYRVIETFS